MSAGTAAAVSLTASIQELFLSIGRYNKEARGKTKLQARLFGTPFRFPIPYQNLYFKMF
jgi:hypothetical protein